MADFADFSFTITAGDSPLFNLAVTKDSVPFDLTGAEMWFTAKSKPTTQADSEALFQKTTASGITITDASGGLVEIQLASGDTNTVIKPTVYYVDVQVKLSGKVYTVAKGKISILAQVTWAN